MSPRSKRQFEVMREKGREKIVGAALKLFAEKGYYSTSMDDVVRRARVSKGSAYHYFDSKEALLEAVVVDGLTAFESVVGQVEGQALPKEKLATLINISFGMLEDDMRFWKLYFSLLTQTTLPTSIKKVLQSVVGNMFEYMRRLFEEMGVEDAGGESKILGAMLDGVFLHYVLVGGDYPLDEMRRKILSLYNIDGKL